LTAGVAYRFATLAENAVGFSSLSYYTVVAVGNAPSAPTALLKYSSRSNKTTITVTWAAVPDTEIETTGYQLYMAPFGSQDFTLVYLGVNRPQKLFYAVTGLTTGQRY
jgi:hypothetical protein